jgi:hypothetical protein
MTPERMRDHGISSFLPVHLTKSFFTSLFYKNICSFTRKFVYLQSTKPVLKDKASLDIDGILKPTKLFVGLAEGKGVYERYHSVTSNLASLNLCTEVMQR